MHALCVFVGCVRLCPSLHPGTKSSTQRSTLRHHSVSQSFKDTLQSIECFVKENSNMCRSGGCNLKYTPEVQHCTHRPCPGRVQNCQATRGKQEVEPEQGEYSESNLSGGPLSRQRSFCCPLLLDGIVRRGRLMTKQGAS